MKKKFFINIFSLVLFLVLFVSFIWPKISLILENREKQLALEQEIADLDKKAEKVESLSQELANNVENQELVLEYIPLTRGDEFLVNYLNGVAYTEGLSLSDIVIEEKKSNLPGEILAPIGLEGGAGSTQGGTELLPVIASPKPVFETVSLNFFASYEKAMVLLRKLDGLKRFNEISYLKITKTYPQENKENADLNFLQIELSLDFNHLKKIASQAEIGETLFSREDFDQEVLAKIKNKAINGVDDLDDKTDGRINPFIP
ncbi:hypothetical protein KJ761_00130 [Patescibacteria group bacterium]|nr:hypothetical protein [Patescibacteria group bacterium]